MLVDRSLEAAKDGDRERAYGLARTAYLDHFEFVEIPLRLRDPNLVLDTEFKFATLRNDIRDGAPLGEIRRDVARRSRGAASTSTARWPTRALAAPLIAFGFSFSILFREGVEAVLLIAILLGSLVGRQRARLQAAARRWACSRRSGRRRDLGARDARDRHRAARAASCSRRSPRWSRSPCCSSVSFWLVSRLEHRRGMEFMRARVAARSRPAARSPSPGSASPRSTARASRRCSSTRRSTLFAEGLELWVALGAVAAAVALGGVAYAILKLGKQLPLQPMLIARRRDPAAALGRLHRQRGALAAGGRPGRRDAGRRSWARLPVFLAELTGIHPTREGLLARRCCSGSSCSARSGCSRVAGAPTAPRGARRRRQ